MSGNNRFGCGEGFFNGAITGVAGYAVQLARQQYLRAI